MLPNRADYKNKKDYKWARKQAQREELANGTGIASARGWASFVTFFALGLGSRNSALAYLGRSLRWVRPSSCFASSRPRQSSRNR